jgi:hypothetical protein
MEDVDFMKQNSIKQNYVFLVDSKDRDRALWPTPAEYVVNFTTPFHNVIGMEVLDAQVPRTMYNVDVFNNTLTFAVGTGTWHTVAVPPGDYTIQTLIPAINAALGAVAPIAVAAVSNPPDVLNKVAFTCPYPFRFDMGRSSMAESLGFDLYATAADASYYAYVGDPRVFASVDRPLPALGPTRTVFEGPRGVLYTQPFTTAPVAQRFALATDGYLAGINVALARPAASADTSVLWSIRPDANNAPSANVVAQGVLGISAVDGSLSDATLPTPPPALAAGTYWLVLSQNPGDTQQVAVYYNDVVGQSTTFLKKASAAPSAAWVAAADVGGIYYQMSATVLVADAYHRIQAPGIYSLVGERYATLRCPEIEDHSFRSLAYTRHNMGLGKIRLGVLGYSENRLDYNRTTLREFHPVGKLARITIRFEAANGQLYDFKGVNHTIVMAIHYYQGVQQKPFVGSVLNPNYTMDFTQYMVHQEDQEEESDDQSADYNEDGETYARWRLNQLRNLPEQRRQQDIEFMQALQLAEEDNEPGENEAADASDQESL